MVQTLNMKVEGHLKIYDPQTGHIFYDDHNALVANAIEVIRRALGSNNFLDTVTAKKAGVTLATVNTTGTIFSVSPDTNELICKATFNGVSFNDTLDELNLESADGIFSEVTGLSIYKDSTTQLGIEWKIKIFI
jgi:hypothetical protein